MAEVRIGDVVVPGLADPSGKADWEAGLAAALTTAGYPTKADSAQVDKPLVIAILFVLVLYVTMVYGPIAVALLTVVVSALSIRDRKDVDLNA